LEGYRGEAKADVGALERKLTRLSDLAMDHPEIRELDINPLLVYAEGESCTVADCRFILDIPPK
jgi:acetyltransferase